MPFGALTIRRDVASCVTRTVWSIPLCPAAADDILSHFFSRRIYLVLQVFFVGSPIAHNRIVHWGVNKCILHCFSMTIIVPGHVWINVIFDSLLPHHFHTEFWHSGPQWSEVQEFKRVNWLLRHIGWYQAGDHVGMILEIEVRGFAFGDNVHILFLPFQQFTYSAFLSLSLE